MKSARYLLGCFRTGEANDPEVFISAVIRILSAYPLDVIRAVIDPLTGIPGRQNWLPTPHEVKAACDEIWLPRQRKEAQQQQIRAQLAERARIENAAKKRRMTYDELIEMCAKDGVFIGSARDRRISDDAATVKARFGISDEQWDAIPDGPPISKSVG